ncbi:hypothetical protein FACS1894172_01090 [Spirochaetia bacterium]|nr:hypothetical protein FACS1894164_06770 [Spirochaetia bacterium]GHU29612.1 hypothetical protein FACS1894172_01090 [Spirochaetia bacterium]
MLIDAIFIFFKTDVLLVWRLEAALVDDGKLIVLDRANLARIREEQGFQDK